MVIGSQADVINNKKAAQYLLNSMRGLFIGCW